MKNFIFIQLSICLSIGFYCNASAQATLSGHVADKSTNEALIGVSIFIPDLKTGGVSNTDGDYTIKNLPSRVISVQVKYIGYATIQTSVDLTKTNTYNFLMEKSSTEIQEAVVTGSPFFSSSKKNSVSISTIDKKTLRTNPASNMVDALTNVPGISQITTGNGISKPVIRGLGYNHVIVLNDGLRQEGNQWGDEHGIEIDQFSADRIEILKGPASLFYGSDAMGGVINILEPMPVEDGKIAGEINSTYAANNHHISNSAMLNGNYKDFVWRARGTYTNSGSYRNPAGYVYNSGYNENTINLLAGINRSWGFSHLHYSTYNTNIGLVEGKKDSATGKFVDAEGHVVPDAQLMGRTLALPFQGISHQKLSLVNNFLIGKGQLKVNAGWQDSKRKEFAESFIVPGLFFNLNTYSYDARYQVSNTNKFEYAFGLSGMTQQNRNEGKEYLVPDFHLQDVGGFVFCKKDYGKITINAGTRYDARFISGDALILDTNGIPSNVGDTLFKPFKSKPSAFSGGIGGTWALSDKFNLKLNIGRGYRTPNIAELSSNGIHEGTFRYEIGNTDLKAETSLQFDAELSAEVGKFSAGINGFYNSISNYIYKRQLNNEIIILNGNSFPVYRFVQGNSTLKGGEFRMDYHPKDNIHFSNELAYVSAENMESKQPLPFIPPFHTRHELTYSFNCKSKNIVNPYLKAEMKLIASQNRIDAFETTTKGYQLFSLSTGTDIRVGKQSGSLFISCNNLFNQGYYDHLSRLKEVSIENMGRNVTFGLNIPFGVR